MINEHRVTVPQVPGLKVIKDSYGPGAYDYLSYRGFEICTFEKDREPAVYYGPFQVTSADGEIDKTVKTLRAALRLIDSHSN